MAKETLQNKPPRLLRLLIKAQNPLMKWLLCSPLHGMVSGKYVLITFTGRKSGKIYMTPVQYIQAGEELYIITSEGYTWWKNLRGGAEVMLHLRGKDYPGNAITSTDPQILSAHVQIMVPGFSAEKRAQFLPGKVAITIRLNGEEKAGTKPPSL